MDCQRIVAAKVGTGNWDLGFGIWELGTGKCKLAKQMDERVRRLTGGHQTARRNIFERERAVNGDIQDIFGHSPCNNLIYGQMI